MRIPYQLLVKSGDVLIAARGPTLETFDLFSGSRISSYTCLRNSFGQESLDESKIRNETNSQLGSEPSAADNPSEQAPPAKKRKLSDAHVEESPNSNGKAAKGRRGKPNENHGRKTQESLNVTVLATDKDGKHVIVVTGEDKTLRVFNHDRKGILQEISQRNMPKRPCAIALTADEKTIVSADKFGDVFSLPLLIPDVADDTAKASTPTPEENRKSYVPAASHLTVHSERNRRALENQLKHAAKPSEKLLQRAFEHTLLLGHVSMLTDLALIRHGDRDYLVTADRDEHIRVSRGIPQTHVIETFCLGHSEFVSRLCFPETFTDIMISGGGNDDLFVWKWLEGRVYEKVDLRSHVEKTLSNIDMLRDEDDEESKDPVSIAVSGIKFTRSGPGTNGNTVIVTCESVPAIFFFSLSDSAHLSHYYTLELDGNPLDLTIDGSSGALFVSIDSIHAPGSRSQLREEIGHVVPPLCAFTVSELSWKKSTLTFDAITENDSADTGPSLHLNDLSGTLYTIENLRKHGGEE